MSKSTAAQTSAGRKSSGTRNWGWLAGCLLLVGVALLALALIPQGGGRKRRPPSGETAVGNTPAKSSSSSSNSASSSSAQSSAAGHSADEHSSEALQKLVGRWKRSDADYVLKIKSVDAQGQIEATYLNPSQIHVEKANAHSHGDAAHLTVELRDVNYPGCIYDLHLDATADQLVGTYFQAALGETYEVKFERAE
ncbi:MAG: hypothetical protein U0939_11065 [Pirellulales bacterium]